MGPNVFGRCNAGPKQFLQAFARCREERRQGCLISILICKIYQIRSKAADGRLTALTIVLQPPGASNSSISRLEAKRLQQASLASSHPEEVEAENYRRLYSQKPDLLPIDVAAFWEFCRAVLFQKIILKVFFVYRNMQCSRGSHSKDTGPGDDDNVSETRAGGKCANKGSRGSSGMP